MSLVWTPKEPPAEKMNERCPERERLLSEWTESSNRVTELLEAQLASSGNADPSFASFAEQIRVAKDAEIEACRRYLGHVNAHWCV